MAVQQSVVKPPHPQEEPWNPSAGRRRPPPLARDHARLPPRPPAAQQGRALSSRSAHRRGDHRGDAHRRRSSDGHRVRALIVILWRAGLRISEALALAGERPRPAAVRSSSAMAKAASAARSGWTVGAGSSSNRGASTARHCRSARCSASSHGPTDGRSWSRDRRPRPNCDISPPLAGVRRRFAPHQLRHAHAVEMAREGVPLPVIQRQLGHYAGDRVKCGRLGGKRARRRGSGRSTPRRAVVSH